MKVKQLLVALCIVFLLFDSLMVLGAAEKNKKDKDKEKPTPENNKNDKEKKPKDEDDDSDKIKDKEEKSEKNDDKEKKAKDEEDKGNKEIDDEPPSEGNSAGLPVLGTKPYGIHGPGEGQYDTAMGKWSGPVWVHYDYNPTFHEWEVGIEGLTSEGETAWYIFKLVESEELENNVFTATGLFTGTGEPLTGLEFTYRADLGLESWELYGEGYYFSGTIHEIFYDEQISDTLKIYSKPEFKAKGTIDAYVNAYSAEVTWGHWTVTLRNGEVEYSAMYKERNLDEAIENSPFDSVDHFWHTLTVEDYSYDGETLWFRGVLHVEKLWVKLDGRKVKTGWDTYPVTIIVDSTSFYLDSPPEGEGLGVYDQDWDRTGTTINVIQKS